MSKRFLYLVVLINITLVSSAQQKPDKKLVFCGWKYTDTATVRAQMGSKLAFYHIEDNSTIVDIGAASGEVEGFLSVIGQFKNVHFILVDIDSNCLNPTKVNNMVTYYSQLKGAPLQQKFSTVRNTPDSLYLPANQYTKAWMLNTLHEIPDKQKMVKDIYNILQKGGEIVVLELLSRPKHTIHGGCKQALLDEQEIKTLFEQNGFTQTDTLLNPDNLKKIINPLYMVRFIKN
jgi:ubiquinone/menaquinone biosynthesis C-methylase UbiE